MLHGPPGVGKTSVAELAAEYCNVQLRAMRVPLYEPVDMTGLPFPSVEKRGRCEYLIPDFMPEEGTEGILFLDELPQASISVQCAAMRMVDHLPEGWQVVAAGNRSTDRAGSNQLATHVLSRFTHVDFDVDRADWQRWSLKANIEPDIRAFIDTRPDLLFVFDAAIVQKERANPSPRSWERASRIMASTLPEALRLETLMGTVGQGAASEYIGYRRIYLEVPSADDILANPEKTPVPKEPSALWAICASLAHRAKTLKTEQLKPMVTYLAKLPLEFGALLMTDLLGINAAVFTLAEAGKWISAHKDIFAGPRR